MANLTPDERYELITKRLNEVLGGNLIKAILQEGRSPKCYWGASAASIGACEQV
jgi:tyrosyl-tRNA synthetase